MAQAYTEIRRFGRRRWCLSALTVAVGVPVAITVTVFLAGVWPIAKVSVDDRPFERAALFGPGFWRPMTEPDYMVCSLRPCTRSGCIEDCPPLCWSLSAGRPTRPPGSMEELDVRDRIRIIQEPDTWSSTEVQQLIARGKARAVAEAKLCLAPDGAFRSVSIAGSTGYPGDERFIASRMRDLSYGPELLPDRNRSVGWTLYGCTTLTVVDPLW